LASNHSWDESHPCHEEGHRTHGGVYFWGHGRVLTTSLSDRIGVVGKPGGPDLRYFGYSVGHWDGDYAFLADTVGTDDKI
jgi:hypothetical protein